MLGNELGLFHCWNAFLLMNQESLLSQFEILLPLAAAWAEEQEQQILRDGVSLSLKELADARTIEVNEPDRVRLVGSRRSRARHKFS